LAKQFVLRCIDAAVLSAFLGLAACSGGPAEDSGQLPGGGMPEPEPTPEPETDQERFDARLAGLDAQATRILGDPEAGTSGLPGAKFDAVLEAGTGTFDGAAAVFAQIGDPTAPTGVLMLGDASLTVNFAMQDLSGRLSNFQVVTASPAPERDDLIAAQPVDATGTVLLTGGAMRAGQPNLFEDVRYAGAIVTDTTRYRISGRTEAFFRGTRSESSGRFPIKAVSIEDADATLTVDGADYLALLAVFGETD
jgi:hypothetical protein